MRDFRLKAYEVFEDLANPIFGPDLKIDFNDITFYKKVSDKVANDWNEINADIKNTRSE